MPSTSQKGMLDVGAGRNPQPDAFAVDIVKYEGKTHLVADVAHLPFREGSFEHVWASDILEHFPIWQVPEVLDEWIRVSSDRITIKTPDLQVLAQAYLAGQIPVAEFARKVYGGGTLDKNPYNMHKSGIEKSSIKLLLETHHLVDVQVTQGTGGDWSNLVATARKVREK